MPFVVDEQSSRVVDWYAESVATDTVVLAGVKAAGKLEIDSIKF